MNYGTMYNVYVLSDIGRPSFRTFNAFSTCNPLFTMIQNTETLLDRNLPRSIMRNVTYIKHVTLLAFLLRV